MAFGPADRDGTNQNKDRTWKGPSVKLWVTAPAATFPLSPVHQTGITIINVKFGRAVRGGDEMLDSLSGRSRHHGEVFEGAAQACGGVVRAVRAQRGGRDPGVGLSRQGGVAHVVSRVAGGAACGGSLEAWRALCEVHGWSEARCGGSLPDAWQAVGQDDAPDGVSRP